MFPVFKKIIVSLLLTSFLSVLFFSLPMMGGMDGSMPEGCPFGATGVSLCPTDTVAMAVHHISAYQSFLTVTTQSGLLLLIIFLLSAVAVLLARFMHPLVVNSSALARSAFASPPADPQQRKIARWLSLLEQSPSLA